jgi:hypothetical protein
MTEERELITIPARRGRAARLTRGQSIQIVNTHGAQVVDTWAFSTEDPREFMSMEHIRPTLTRIFPRAGDDLVTNRRRPILHFAEDTSPGVHDTLMAACDDYRYGLLGCSEYHDNCTDNLFAALRSIGLSAPECPSPLNLWMNIPVDGDGNTAWGVRRRQHRLGRPRLQARRLRGLTGRDGLRGRHVLLPARHPPHKRRSPRADRGALSDLGVGGAAAAHLLDRLHVAADAEGLAGDVAA